MDEFKHYNKDKWIIEDNGQTIKKNARGYHTAYTRNIIKCNTDMHYHWRIKINQGYHCSIGIDESNYIHKNNDFNSWLLNDTSIHYGYFSLNGGTMHDSTGKSVGKFGPYGRDDIVNVYVDTHRNKIGFSLNNNPIRTAFDLKETQIGYSLAINTLDRFDSFSILSFT
eukprot:225696_1